jgi:hypothetical protein
MNLERPKAILLMFWDYDTQWGADRSRRPGGALWDGLQEFENTESLLALLKTYDMKACFAIVGAAALPGVAPYHNPNQIRRIFEEGHEIASHSMYHQWLPGLGGRELLCTLRDSKDVLEQVTGSPVVTFVPPYNQPFDYSAGFSFSLSERLEAKRGRRNGLKDLCEGLRVVGYKFCRVAHRPMHQRLAERLFQKNFDRPETLTQIAGVTCVRLNTPGGFDAEPLKMLEKVGKKGGIIVAYGHPHSLHSGNSQDECFLIPFLNKITELRINGTIQVALPKELI